MAAVIAFPPRWFARRGLDDLESKREANAPPPQTPQFSDKSARSDPRLRARRQEN
jgi:hypothetical protein